VLLPHWDDITMVQSGDGVYYQVSGVAPNRVLHVVWRGHLVSSGQPIDFETRLYEGLSQIDFIYGAVPGNGAGATIGIQQGTGPNATQVSCNTASIFPGAVVTLTYGGPNYAVSTPTITSTPLRTPNSTLPTATPPAPACQDW